MPKVTRQSPGPPPARTPISKSSVSGAQSSAGLTPKSSTSRPQPNGRLVSVIDRIAPIDVDDYVKMLVYGRSGTGKTTLWATFPGPILVMICSGGQRPGELKSINTAEYRGKIQQVVIQSTQEIPEVLDHVKRTGKYQTVVQDHASGLQDLTLKEILGLEELPAQKSWGMASQQQYGQSSLMCKEILRAILSLDTNVVIVAQEREFKAEGDSELINPTIGAALTPSVVGWLNPACDYIVHTFLQPKMVESKQTIGKQTSIIRTRGKGVEYCLRTGPHDVYQTKFRVPKGHTLPDAIEDPSYDKILKAIRGE